MATDYDAPLADMRFVLEELCDYAEIAALPGFEDLGFDDVSAVLDEAARFAGNILAPLNRAGDEQGAKWTGAGVTTAPGWVEAYKALVAGGWNSPAVSADHGGMGLPHAVNAAIQEMFQSANLSFGLCSMLTQAAIEAIELYASADIREAYLDKLVSGEWTGTMNLTEPQAGSDLAAVRTRAQPDEDIYRIKGQKIFITYGDHDLTDNIIHLVLARLPDAPEGVKGISLFVVPKIVIHPAGGMPAANDLRCVSIEHKLGIHGSPTCTMAYGDGDGAIGYLVGEPNRGLEYMFTMMNAARLNVGIQGVAIADRAYQAALGYARERKQGRAPGAPLNSAIIEHADVRRMLGLMRARTEAARAICYMTARSIDFASRSSDAEERARHQRRVDLLIPVAKGWSTEMAIETASIGVQVHGGMGYIEETGAAQHLRDARITAIYEGTTGIQALDLVGRKILRDNGRAAKELLEDMRRTATDMQGETQLGSQAAALAEAADMIEQCVGWLLDGANGDPALPGAAAVNMLHLFGIGIGAWLMAQASLRATIGAAQGSLDPGFAKAKVATGTFYAAQIFPEARARRDAIIAGTDAILMLEPELFS